MQWQYRTVLFEFQKDGLLGDKYIDDEEVEALLNEQGARGWELVNVAMIQEGLLAFCKRQITTAEESGQQGKGMSPAVEQREERPAGDIYGERFQEEERQHIRHLESRQQEKVLTVEQDRVGGIKIS